VLRSPCCVKFTGCKCFISRMEYVYLYKNVEAAVMYLKSFVLCLHFSCSRAHHARCAELKRERIMLRALRP
jgi:hypothetical protein